MKNNQTSRRRFFHSAAFGMFALSVNASPVHRPSLMTEEELFYRYPAIRDELISQVVGASHGRFDRVKELVTARPELAKASWDWGFGDIESALGAASHMGRRDIAEFLMEHGARPDIFTFAMLGQLEVVQAMVAAAPGIQRTLGPHGFTVLEHAKSRLWHKDISASERQRAETMIAYLESLGDADQQDPHLPISPEEQEVYIGDYSWGDGEDETFFVSLNRRKLLQLGRNGTFGRSLNRIDEHLFTPDGAGSVRIQFTVEDGRASAVSVIEHDFTLTATRV